MTTAFMSASCA